MSPLNGMILMKKSMQEELGKSATLYLNIWIYFNLVGNTILLPIIVATFIFSKRVKRHPTLINLCMTWIFSGIFSLLLFYSKQHTGPEPDPSLCVAQASLLYGITPMWSVAVLAMVYYMLHTLRGDSSQSKLLKGLPMTAMLSAPYIAQWAFTIAALVLSFQDPTKVNRKHQFFFCSLKHLPLLLAMSIFTLLMCIAIITLEVALAMVIYRNWHTRRCAGVSSELPLPLIVRVLVFGIYVALGMVVVILSMFGASLAADVFAATAGTVVFLIFGTQADVFRAWCFWRKSEDDLALPNTAPPMSTTGSPYSPSLEALFKSAKSETRFPWSERRSRPPSQYSTRRSTKNFVRLADDAEDPPNQDLTVRTGRERGTADSSMGERIIDVLRSPKRARLKERRKSGAGDEVGKQQNARKRRRDDPPRPKGPRKASLKPLTSTAGSSSTRPPPVPSRPSALVSASVDSMRTLDAESNSPAS
ncbi:hypothetical protein P691DRAFT_779470 [Macrolepiota fuliginosa MF-IS2]|uniref:Uncharacterized protein n=1 Tax=Macrolepiota fuliginosa MF-IS2 TaxID=1400762 RepID=A0A9P6BVY3_9AGAR|nr:hypothetical protein P691DRAFT_779470 [Macrolepiota fuliginosa MF-IS2]